MTSEPVEEECPVCLAQFILSSGLGFGREEKVDGCIAGMSRRAAAPLNPIRHSDDGLLTRLSLKVLKKLEVNVGCVNESRVRPEYPHAIWHLVEGHAIDRVEQTDQDRRAYRCSK